MYNPGANILVKTVGDCPNGEYKKGEQGTILNRFADGVLMVRIGLNKIIFVWEYEIEVIKCTK